MVPLPRRSTTTVTRRSYYSTAHSNTTYLFLREFLVRQTWGKTKPLYDSEILEGTLKLLRQPPTALLQMIGSPALKRNRSGLFKRLRSIRQEFHQGTHGGIRLTMEFIQPTRPHYRVDSDLVWRLNTMAGQDTFE